jgi:hypothetical protein
MFQHHKNVMIKMKEQFDWAQGHTKDMYHARAKHCTMCNKHCTVQEHTDMAWKMEPRTDK